MRLVETASAAVDRACLFFAKAALIGITLTIAVQITARYGLDSPFAWTEELARYLMVWGGLLGATCAFRRGLDPVIVSVGAETPRGRQIVHRALLAATVVIFLAPLLHYSVFGAGFNLERGFLWRSANRESPGLGANMAVVGAVVPLTCVVIFLHALARLMRPLGR